MVQVNVWAFACWMFVCGVACLLALRFSLAWLLEGREERRMAEEVLDMVQRKLEAARQRIEEGCNGEEATR